MLAAAAATAAAAAAAAAGSSQTTWTTYCDGKYGFTLPYAPQWVVRRAVASGDADGGGEEEEEEVAGAGDAVTFLMVDEALRERLAAQHADTAQGTTPEEDVLPKLVVLVQDLTSNPMSLADFTMVSKYHLETVVKHEVEVVPQQLGGLPGSRTQYFSQEPLGLFGFCQAWTIKDDRAYVVTFSARADDESRGQFHELLPLFAQCLAGFSLEHTARLYKSLCASMLLTQYVNLQHLVGVRVPSTWERKEWRREEGTVAEFRTVTALTTDPAEVPVLLKLTITVCGAAPAGTPTQKQQPLTLDAYSRLVESQLAQIGVSQLRVTDYAFCDGHPGHLALFDTTLLKEGTQFAQAWGVRGRRAFAFTCASSCGSDDRRPLPIFERILSTVRFLSPDDDVDEVSCCTSSYFSPHSHRTRCT
eukprot:TRINITY_DN6535_c0_g1_i4.p1 TRINITY_DN6535_c0_g1~~TRINITY_DN6535_c0_g1_i4.p1  ORF type:complete len:427 (+),score=117.64 TRINITY_DN6535_c0_g1_i4:33-1283(+)